MRRGAVAVTCAAAVLLVSACGDAPAAAPAASAPATSTPATTQPATTTTHATSTTTTLAAVVTDSSTTSSSTSTSTVPSLTVPDTLPNPEAPPDGAANEPLVALGTIEIPKIGVTKSMYEGITLSTLDHGPGHWPGTAMPGRQGNVVVAGHRVSHDKPFRNLDKLSPGDEVVFTTDAGRFVYKVTSIEVVRPEALWIVDQTPDFTGTLFACHPPGSTRQRIVVHLAFAPTA
ncbi:MAG TPA: class E sortase [Ilumatobacteraceae bacterium]|nr:class E sortase [Ilumatobacteraceae bacterium]